MARKALIEKTKRTEKLIEKYAEKRAALLAIIKNPDSDFDERREAYKKLNDLPRNSSKVRHRNRCYLTGRSRGYYRKFGLSRIAVRELALRGELPGVVKASW